MNQHTKKRILIVDDEEDLLMLNKQLLTDHLYDVTTSTNGHEALKLIKAHSFDLIISDALMPVMDGFTLLSEVEKLGREIPSIIISGHVDLDQNPHASLAKKILIKPVDFDEFLSEVERLTVI